MRISPPILFTLALCGCNYSAERFATKVSFEWCDWRHGCGEVDAKQAEMCWTTEQASWNERLAAEECEFASDRSKRLYKVFVGELAATNCDLSEAYTLLAELADDICQQPHSSVDTQEDPEDTGDTASDA